MWLKRVSKPGPAPEIAISDAAVKIKFCGNGLNIFWNGAKVTEGVGLNLSISTLGLWTDSAKADWQILEKGEKRFKFMVAFRELPLSLLWEISLEDNGGIYWKIDMQAEEWMHIDEFRVVCLVCERYKTWLADSRQCDFPQSGRQWQDLYLSDGPVSIVGVRFPTQGKSLPSFIIETGEDSWCSLVQNVPSQEGVHLVGLRRAVADDRHDYCPGHSHVFSGRLGLFSKDNLLDNKMENFRRESLKTFTNEKVKCDKTRRRLKILLANLPWYKNGRWGVRAGSRWPHIKDESEQDYLPFPFFLAYAASLLHKFDIDVSLTDAVAGQISEESFLRSIINTGINYLVAETSIPSFEYDLTLLEKISQAGISVILCGPNSEICRPEFLKKYPFIDFVLCGEYEFTLLELVQCLQAGRDLSGVNGLIYRDNGMPVKNPARQPFDINSLPWPHRSSLPMGKYLDAPGELPLPSVQMIASRGCPFKCQFCLWPQVMYGGRHYRSRSVEDTVDEMEYLVKEKGFKSVYFDDDTFNIGKERMLDFCRELKSRGLDKTPWAIMARADLMDKEILENMKSAGLWAVKYGVESANQKLVDKIEKNMDLKKTEEMIRLTNKLGIRIHLTFTFGLPGETAQTIQKTIRFAQSLDPFSVQFSITTPFPGTKYYETMDKMGFIVSKNFSDFDGHCKSTIRMEKLQAHELESAKEMAYRSWREHLRKKRGLSGDIKKFYSYVKNNGPGYALFKAVDYLSYICLKRPGYLKMRKNIWKIR